MHVQRIRHGTGCYGINIDVSLTRLIMCGHEGLRDLGVVKALVMVIHTISGIRNHVAI